MINYIKEFIIKFLFLFFIWSPEYHYIIKFVLTFLWLLKIAMDYDIARPGHAGNIYKVVKKYEIEVQDMICECMRLILVVLFGIITIMTKNCLLCILSTIIVLLNFISVIGCVKEIMVKKNRREK